MKKTFLLCMMLVASFSLSAREVPKGYVDLGLDSGTLWKAKNEPGQYLFLGARNKFGNQLPTEAQFFELKMYCSWKLTDKGYRVTGPNGNTLMFPFDGFMDCEENPTQKGLGAFLWLQGQGGYSSSKFFLITPQEKISYQTENCNQLSVRLVLSEIKQQ